jgi:nucleotide-binding universal stress UspA family protein
LREIAQQLHDRGVEADYEVESGQAAQAILDYAAHSDIDQIVMATHGYTGFKRWTHGSVAERVLQAAGVPVLMLRVRQDEVAEDWSQPVPCGRILVPLDGSPAGEQVLPIAGELAQAVGAQLILFQVPIAHATGSMTGEWFIPMQGVLATAEADAQTYLQRVARRLALQQVSVATATTVGSVAECIVDYAQACGADLIAMCTHGRTGIARWTLGSVADRVLRAGTTPILLVRAGAVAVNEPAEQITKRAA